MQKFEVVERVIPEIDFLPGTFEPGFGTKSAFLVKCGEYYLSSELNLLKNAYLAMFFSERETAEKFAKGLVDYLKENNASITTEGIVMV